MCIFKAQSKMMLDKILNQLNIIFSSCNDSNTFNHSDKSEKVSFLLYQSSNVITNPSQECNVIVVLVFEIGERFYEGIDISWW